MFEESAPAALKIDLFQRKILYVKVRSVMVCKKANVMRRRLSNSHEGHITSCLVVDINQEYLLTHV